MYNHSRYNQSVPPHLLSRVNSKVYSYGVVDALEIHKQSKHTNPLWVIHGANAFLAIEEPNEQPERLAEGRPSL